MPLDTHRIRLVCFDIDGTLRDTDDQMVAWLAARLAWLKFLFAKGDTQRFARRILMAVENPGNALLHLTDRLGFDAPLSRMAQVIERLNPIDRSQRHALIPGVLDALESLQRHYPLAVVSVRSQLKIQDFLDRFGLQSFFDCIANGQTCKHTKPFPDPILWVAEQVGIPASGCLMVGDTRADIRAGVAAGAQTVGVLSGFGEEKELVKAGANLVLPSVACLPELLIFSTS